MNYYTLPSERSLALRVRADDVKAVARVSSGTEYPPFFVDQPEPHRRERSERLDR